VAIAYLTSLVAMLLGGWSSDRTDERRWHTVVPMWAGALGIVGAAAFQAHTALLVPCLCLAIAGITTFVTGLWSLITSRVSGRGGAVAVGLINSTGNLGGFAGPYALGALKDTTGQYTIGLLYLVAVAALAGVLVLCVNLKRLG